MTNNKYHIGTEMKLNISVDPIGDITMETYDFVVDVFCSPSKVLTISKEDAIKVDANNYILLIDTTALGTGKVKVKLTAIIPDDDFSDGFRTEIAIIDTGINIVKA